MKSIMMTLVATMAGPLVAETWPQFRGPEGSGVVKGVQLPPIWSNEENLAWRSKVGGKGWSSPIVVGQQVFVTAAEFPGQPRPSGFRRGVSSMRSYRKDSEKLMTETAFKLHCLNLADGALQWSRTLATRTPEFTIHPSNTYATGSPATNGEAVFAHFAAAGIIAATDLAGKELWARDIGAFKAGNGFGAGSSLSIGRDLLYLQCDNDEESFVLAIDPWTGEDRWRVDRETRTSWSTPVLWQNHLRAELIVCGADTVTSFAPGTGEELWKLSGFGGSFSASPAFDAQRIYFGNSGPGSVGPLTTVEAGATGRVPYQKGQPSKYSPWARTGSGPGLSSPVAYKGLLYISAGTGILSCFDTSSGERLYQERLPSAERIAASLWVADDELYALDEGGTTHVIQTGPDFKVLRQNTIEDLFWSTPAVLDRALILRGADYVYCIRQPVEASESEALPQNRKLAIAPKNGAGS